MALYYMALRNGRRSVVIGENKQDAFKREAEIHGEKNIKLFRLATIKDVV